MPKLGITYCVDIMLALKKDYDFRVPATEVSKMIRIKAGVTDSVRARYYQLLQDFGFITPSVTPGFFDIHWEVIETFAKHR
jgi:hypothetical protein